MSIETLHRRIFSDEIFPSHPFRDPAWIGLAFDRDKHDYSRIPENVLRAFLGIAAESASARVSVHGLGVNFSDSACGEGSKEVELTADRYLQLVFDESWYSPEYKIAEETGAWGMWLHWDWSILGGPRAMMSKVFVALGGEACVWSMIEQEFALSLHSAEPALALYLQTLVGRHAGAA